MEIFELLGARRVKLSQNKCGFVHFGAVYSAFTGHVDFKDEKLWAQGYSGPTYSRDLLAMMQAESQLELAGLHGAYAARLVPLVYPKWEDLSSGEEVWDFWFELTHAPVERRFLALWRMRAQLRGVQFENPVLTDFFPCPRDIDVLVRAIELAPPDEASGESRMQSSTAFRTFVEELTPYEAVVLLTQMYVGRGDFAKPHNAVAELGAQYESNAVIADQMLSKGTLQRNLNAAMKMMPRGGW
jgi:hypothetical protein